MRALLVPTALAASCLAAAPAEARPRPSTDCLALFAPPGDERLEVLEEVAQSATAVDIVHSGAFRRPAPLRVRGIELVGTREHADGTRRAVLEVQESLARLCEPGLYALREGALIGDMRVLAVLSDLVLLENGGQLAYLNTPGSSVPVFRMTWASPWRLVEPREVRPGKKAPARRSKRGKRR